MRNIKLTIEYDGSRYQGWTRLGKNESSNTIFNKIQEVLRKMTGCLPAAKMLVEYITMAPYQSIASDKCKEIEEKAPLLTRVYDLVITSPEKVMQVDAIVISGHTVCGYTSNEKTDETKAARYIKEMLHNHKYEKVTVKVFHDYVAFLSRAEGMNSIAAIEKPDNRRRERRIRHLLLTTSM